MVTFFRYIRFHLRMRESFNKLSREYLRLLLLCTRWESYILNY